MSLSSDIDLGLHAHFYGTVRIACSFCNDARGFQVTWDQNQMKAAGSDYIGKQIHRAFKRLEEGVRKLSWVFSDSKWFCARCVDMERDQ